MLNLHAPFRLAVAGDLGRPGIPAGIEPGQGVVADESGRIVGALAGGISGETWRVTALAVAPERLDDLGRRILAVADALAADEGLAAVTLDASGLGEAWQPLLDQEGFRPAGQGGWLSRPVVPQG
jgi:hypothetical protein